MSETIPVERFLVRWESRAYRKHHNRLDRAGASTWWISMLNLIGSIAFGVSAVAASVVPGSGEPRNAELVNLGTFVGALGFLVGALLLLPERTQSPGPAPAAAVPLATR